MGAKVGNIGGGMVELFSTSASVTPILLSSAQIDTFKDLLKQYDLVLLKGTDALADGRICYLDTVINAQSAYDFFNGTVDGNLHGWQGNDGLSLRFEKSSGTTRAYCRGHSSTGNRTVTLKIYGVKL